MAKKQQPKLSYGPNLGLVGGAKTLAESEVAKTSAGGQAFAQNLTGSVLAGIAAQKMRDDKMDAYLDDLGGIQNINLLDQGYNKEAVTEFLRNGRDEYAKLAAEFERTGNRALKDKMDEIKFSFSNLNTQLQGLVKERKDYADAYDKKQLVTLENGDEIFTDMYTNRSQFNIEANGDLGFGSGDTYKKFKDVAGKWNVKNNIGETFTLSQNLEAKKLGEKNGVFYRDDIKNLYTAKFKETGPEGIMVMAKTDLTGDNEYILPNGQKAGNLSFESMWSQGLLDDKFYQQIPKGTDSKWMYDKENVDTLNNLMSEYYTDVTKSSYDQGKKNYKPRGSGTSATAKSNEYGFGSKSVEISGKRGSYLTQNQRTTRRNNIENNEDFQGWMGNYEWDEDAGGYVLLDGEGNRTGEPKTKWKVMQDEMLVGNKDRQVDYDSLGVQKSGLALDTKGKEVKGGVTLDLLDGDDNTVANSLNSYIPKNSNYSFRPKTSGSFFDPRGMFDVFAGEDLVRNAVELVDGDGKPIMWKGEKLVLFTSSGGGMETATKNAQDAAVANFNDWLGQQNDFELQTGGNTGVGATEPEDVN